MVASQSLHLATILACVAALGAAGLAVGAAVGGALDRCGSPAAFQWARSAVVAAGTLSAACAACMVGMQALQQVKASVRTKCTKRDVACVAVAAVGFAAHTAMLVAVTVYWQRCITRAYIQPYAGGSSWGHGHVVHRRINYFEYWEQWSPLEAALYWAGCAAGILTWLAVLALVGAQAADAACARRGGTLAEPLLPASAGFVCAVHPSPLQQAIWVGEEPAELASTSSCSSPCSPRRRHASSTEEDAESCSSSGSERR